MSSFADSLHEVFARMGRIQTRRMFGGHGIYHDSRMFALVARDTLYLKADGESAAFFDALALPAFSYERAGQPAVVMSYRQAPEEIFDDAEQAAVWGRRAFEAAVRSGRPRKAKGAVATKRTASPAARKRGRKVP